MKREATEWLVVSVIYLMLQQAESVEKICSGVTIRSCNFDHISMQLMCNKTNLATVPNPKEVEKNLKNPEAPVAKCRVLYLDDNCLKQLNLANLVKYTHLETLVLSNNLIPQLKRKDFATSNLIKLETLDLSNNKISRIRLGAFTGLDNLKQLYLGHNQLQELHQDTFEGVKNIVVLKVNDNLLNEISTRAFRNLKSLKTLDLSGNNIVNIQALHLTGLNNLKSLFLQRNNLTHFTELVPSRSLKELDLRNNSLRDLDNSLFQETELAVIRLSGNKLKSPNRDWFIEMYQQDRKELFDGEDEAFTANNPWICDCNINDYRHFLKKTLGSKEWWASKLDIECQSPPMLKGRWVSELTNLDICYEVSKYTSDNIIKLPVTPVQRSVTLPHSQQIPTTQKRDIKLQNPQPKIDEVYVPFPESPQAFKWEDKYTFIAIGVIVLLTMVVSASIAYRQICKNRNKQMENSTNQQTPDRHNGSNFANVQPAIEEQVRQNSQSYRSNRNSGTEYYRHRSLPSPPNVVNNQRETIPKELFDCDERDQQMATNNAYVGRAVNARRPYSSFIVPKSSSVRPHFSSSINGYSSNANLHPQYLYESIPGRRFSYRSQNGDVLV